MPVAGKDVFAGIDVSKDWANLAVRPLGAAWCTMQDEAGVAALVRRLQELRPRLVALEATGGYKVPLVPPPLGQVRGNRVPR